VIARLAPLTATWLPVLLWMVVILFLSGQSEIPPRTNPATGETVRATYTAAKLAHILEYGVLGALLLRALRSTTGGLGLAPTRGALWSVLAAAAFGAADELWQAFVPNRSPSVIDVVIDGTSALACVTVWLAWQRCNEGHRAHSRVLD
jgi:hypothetical protein